MTQPRELTPPYVFLNDQTVDPAHLQATVVHIAEVVNHIRTNLSLIQRDDTQLADKSVSIRALADEVYLSLSDAVTEGTTSVLLQAITDNQETLAQIQADVTQATNNSVIAAGSVDAVTAMLAQANDAVSAAQTAADAASLAATAAAADARSSDKIELLDLISSETNQFVINEGWTVSPLSGVFYLKFPTTNTGASTVSVHQLTDTYPIVSKGQPLTYSQLRTDTVYPAKFDGTVFDIGVFGLVALSNAKNGQYAVYENGALVNKDASFYFDASDFSVVSDRDKPTKVEIFNNKAGVVFSENGEIQPMGNGVFSVLPNRVLNMTLHLQAKTAESDKNKNISVRFVDSEGNTVRVVTLTDESIGNSTNLFTINVPEMLEVGTVTEETFGRFEVQIEDADTDNHSGEIHLVKVGGVYA